MYKGGIKLRIFMVLIIGLTSFVYAKDRPYGSIDAIRSPMEKTIDGYFDDSIYSYYELHLKNVRKASSSNNEEFFMRANTGGSSNSSLAYWTTANGNANDGGGIWESHRADNDGNGIAHMDNTWHMPHNGNTAGSAHYHLRIVEPQSTTRYKNVYWQHVSNRHNSSGTYRAILGHHMCNVETTTALTGFTFSAGSSGNFECTATLYGFKFCQTYI